MNCESVGPPVSASSNPASNELSAIIAGSMQTGEGQEELPEILHGMVHHPANNIDIHPEIAADQRGQHDDCKYQQQAKSEEAPIDLGKGLRKETKQDTAAVERRNRDQIEHRQRQVQAYRV